MAKRGLSKHIKRIAVSKAVPITDKKAKKWMIRPSPGPHSRKYSMPLAVLLRDVLRVAKTAQEAQKILSAGLVTIDGKIKKSVRLPVGLMDVVSFAKLDKNYRLSVDWKGRLVPKEISKEEASSKILRVTGKTTVRGGKIALSFHDGKTMIADNNVNVGDSVIISLPKTQIKKHLKRGKGSLCLVWEGKHVGSIVTLKELTERKGGKPSEALVNHKDGDFITIANYLFVVDDSIKQ
ncbi:30S ribosomal protein S4e [Candidatus Micrarchaeota archaeon]|nr:30S ribosomal protein S4e [Candidatus Micrarchaeota archaeon]